MKKFFVMTRGRTGSTAIVDVLNKSNNVCAAQELFLKFEFEKKDYKKYLIPPYELWKNTGNVYSVLLRKISNEAVNIEKYLNHAEKIMAENSVNAFCFKLLSHNFDEIPALKKQLLKSSFKTVYLTRNVPRQVISGMVAKLRGIYNMHEREGYSDNASYVIDVDEFKSLVKWETKAVANDIAMLESSGFEFIQVRYEDFVHNPDAFFANIFSFINIPQEILPDSSFSIMIKDLSKVVKNYDEVYSCVDKLGLELL
ncbi:MULTISPECIES: sulfotransferase [Porticoccus]|jgi:LPS sulfotransferase NodH|uniref:sulfotransferase n=1 Tax=Porticoccus TaxID=1123967 RepID=UPI000C65C484|nr:MULTISPECIES: sulfotransferase [Porticoccus]MAZ69715.1 hypothetical protein [Porticoccus sp.]|tara:strand:+ start:323 stop:1087 length:765 start_codon:yes stop_codon:yes gene_type:complete